ncbi:response regulator [Nodularia chucula]|uniref:hybrid sensor histidine kinase/response regulator n=1 Tax=Nodularia chucula TaxID=3093667 RepID=UPI0039C67490
MLPEQQQRILGYFIEEAKEHLNTIEQALLNLQSTLNDPEMVNELFRAAHSIKGSAAMLGLNSIQHTSHRLEDCFKVLKEHPVKVDQKLESLFLGVCDTLKVLLEHLSGPFGLSDEAANTLMSETEPVFEWLNEHLELLVQQSINGVIAVEANGQDVGSLTDLFLRDDVTTVEEESESTSTASPYLEFIGDSLSPLTVRDYGDEFQTEVLQILRQMLQLFKKPTHPESRNHLQECCHQLVRLGERWDLSHWCSLCQAAASAIANSENSYLTLAKIVITEIKQAQELVLQDKNTEIQVSEQLAALINLPEVDLLSEPEAVFPHQPTFETQEIADEALFATPENYVSEATISQPIESITSLSELSEQIQSNQETLEPTENTVPETALTDIFFLDAQEEISVSNVGQNGPEVGLAELNTLADLFNGETPELDQNWEQKDNSEISSTNELGIDFRGQDVEDSDSDLADFLSFDLEPLSLQNELTSQVIPSEESQPYSSNEINSAGLSNDLLVAETQENELLTTDVNTESEQILTNAENSSDDLSLETDNADIEDILLDDFTESNPTLVQPDSLTIDALFDDFDQIENTSSLSQDDAESDDLFDAIPASVIEFTEAEDNFNDFWNEEGATEQQNEAVPSVEQDVAQALEDSLFAAAASSNMFGNIGEIASPFTGIQEELDEIDVTLPSESDDSDDLFGDVAAFSFASEGDEDLAEISGFGEESEIVAEIASPFTAIKEESDETDVTLPSESDDGDDLFGDVAAFSFVSEGDDALSSDETDVTLPSDSDDGDDLFGDVAAFSFASEGDEDLAEISGFGEESEIVAEIASPFTAIKEESDATDLTLPSNSDDGDDLFGDAAAFSFASEGDEDLAEISGFGEESEIVAEIASPFTAIKEESDATDLTLPSNSDDGDDLFGDAAAFSFASEGDDALSLDATDVTLPSDSDDGDDLFGDVAAFSFASEGDDALSLDATDMTLPSDSDDGDDLFGDVAAFSFASEGDEDLEESAEESNLGFGEERLGEETDYLSDDLLNIETISENTELAESENADFVVAEEALTTEEATPENDIPTEIQDQFAELEALLEEESEINSLANSMGEEDFADLEALLNTSDNDQQVNESHDLPSYARQLEVSNNETASQSLGLSDVDDEFSDLEKLLAEADQTISHSSANKPTLHTSKISRGSDRRTARFEETMKVPVKQLDDMSNLVGELVVNRNTLEQDHERLRQSLDNLLIQVQHLSDVGARMEELYERSLLEASLLASRKTKDVPGSNSNNDHSHTKMGFSELEMDRFTPFHTLSQEMIEFIVRVRESASDIDFVTEETERVARQFRQVTTQLQEGLTRTRMVPFSQTIDRLRRGVRDNAIKYGKQVELVISGGDTLIDKMILDHLTDPLTHMLNNAIAHGIETPDIREKAGKPPVGYITIRAFYKGNQTLISVGDDGAGIDPRRVKTKAIQMGMITSDQAKSMSRMEVYDLLFQPGFSIKDEADEISGRGVGMDVVRSEISEIRGIVNTDSTIGQGTTFTIRLPLTLSICKALCCVSDKARIAFPMDGVEDTLDIPVKSIQHHPDGQSYISWRDTLLPFRPLKELLTFNRLLSRGNVYGGNRDDDMVSVVVVRSGNTLIALQIDLVLSEQEIVIKQFESPAPKPIGVAGATILGDGRIMPIADVLEIIEIFQGRISKHNGHKLWQQQGEPTLPETTVEKIDPTVLIIDDSITVRELLSLTFIKAGYRVEQARDGQEAWEKLRSGLPCDIVFCDIEMPRCDGLELLSRIQKDSQLNHLPIAMLTSRGADKHRQTAFQLGASGYFTKPYLEDVLLEAAVRMLSGEKLLN